MNIRLPVKDASRLVLVGVDSYADPAITDLPAVERNLADLEKVLCDPQHGGFAADRCTVISQPQHATNMTLQIVKLGKDCSDVFLVYFAGHAVRDTDGSLLLMVADTLNDAPHVSDRGGGGRGGQPRRLERHGASAGRDEPRPGRAPRGR